MRGRLLWSMIPVLGWLLGIGGAFAPAAEPSDLFESRVRPLFVKHCEKCHGPEKQRGGLRLDSLEGWRKGGESGTAIVPGKPEESLIIKAVNHTDAKLRMPPNAKLAEHELAALAEWVKRGAVDPRDGGPARLGGMTLADAKKWWSFQPLKRPQIPKRNAGNPIDAFLLDKLAAMGLSLSPPADPRTLIRRATYDLTGLPPTPQEVEEFVKASVAKPQAAFEEVIDRLLASPHYGERWGRHWLDLVRYADTAGENSDHPLPHAWRYRNWVIDAFNRDQPYDEFLREQVAGDILAAKGPPEKYADQVVATGFLSVARRFGHDIDKDMHLTHEDVIDTLGKAVLGLTLGCARCHDHKYDPVSAKDYYALHGIFASTKFSFPGCEPQQQPRDLMPLLPRAEWDRLPKADQQLQVAYAVTEGTVQNTRLHQRGDPEKPGEEVPRRWLEVLGGDAVPKDSGSGRQHLAEKLSSADNPLTARVMVNRMWLHHFGKGLVQTPNDFGSRGQPPTHSELLDYLAAEFIASGWSVKALHRCIMLSAAYQQASAAHAEGLRHDPNNDLLWRFDRRRLSAEELRDSLLVMSGRLDRSPGGPHPFPLEKSWNFTQHTPFNAVYDTDRRSVYLMISRNRRHPFLGLFDGADPNATTPQRQETTIPTQALYFMNDPFFHAQAEALASRLPPGDDEARLDALFRTAFQRQPTPREHVTAQSFLKRYMSEVADVPLSERPRASWTALTRVLLAGNEFLYLD